MYSAWVADINTNLLGRVALGRISLRRRVALWRIAFLGRVAVSVFIN